MTIFDDYILNIEKQEIPELEKQLAPLKNGTMKLSSKGIDGREHDLTQHWIDHLEKTIRIFEGIVAEYRATGTVR